MEEMLTTRGPKWDDIVAMARMRVSSLDPMIAMMRDVLARYKGDIVYPWAEELSKGQATPQLNPHLMAEAIDNYGMRASEVLPMIHCPSSSRTRAKARGYAMKRKGALEHTLMASKYPLQTRRYMRHLAGYATANVLIEPDMKSKRPLFRVVNPMNSFPDPSETESIADTTNCIYIHGHSMDSILARFPHLSSAYGGPLDKAHDQGEMWDMIRYVDVDVQVLGLGGMRTKWSNQSDPQIGRDAIEILRIENRTERFPGAVMPKVSLDAMSNNLASMVGQLDIAAKLQLLNMIATEKAIFPDVYILGENSRTPQIHTNKGQWVDGRTGQANVISDASAIGVLRNTPDQAGERMIDGLERNFRVSTGLASQFGGETNNALRTGRAIDTMLGASVDPRVRELQETAEAFLPQAFEAILDMYEGYWPDREYEIVGNWGTDDVVSKFIPSRDFADTKKVAVKYAAPGTDNQGLTIVLGQMLGVGAIPLDDFRRLHPLVTDPDRAGRKVTEEALEAAALSSIQQGASTMQLPLDQVAMIQDELHKEGADIFTAVMAATERMKKQAEAEAAANPQPDPAMQAAPMDPTMGAAPADAIGPTQGQEGMRQLMNAMRSSNQGV